MELFNIKLFNIRLLNTGLLNIGLFTVVLLIFWLNSRAFTVLTIIILVLSCYGLFRNF